MGDSNIDVVAKLFEEINLDKAEVVTLYYGEDAEAAEAEQIAADITGKHPALQVEVIRGGQPHYSYIISVE